MLSASPSKNLVGGSKSFQKNEIDGRACPLNSHLVTPILNGLFVYLYVLICVKAGCMTEWERERGRGDGVEVEARVGGGRRGGNGNPPIYTAYHHEHGLTTYAHHNFPLPFGGCPEGPPHPGPGMGVGVGGRNWVPPQPSHHPPTAREERGKVFPTPVLFHPPTQAPGQGTFLVQSSILLFNIYLPAGARSTNGF